MDVPPMDVASVDLALMTTRSVRRRIDFERPVEPEVLERCIEVATQAPTGLNAEAWRFLVLTEPEVKSRVAEIYRRAFGRLGALREEWARRSGQEPPPLRPAQRALADHLETMPALILVCSEGRPDEADVARQVAFYGSVLPAAWSLMVALRARGLGATWTTLHLMDAPAAAEALGIPEDVTQTVLLPVGYTKDAKLAPAARKGPAEVTYWNRWGAPRRG